MELHFFDDICRGATNITGKGERRSDCCLTHSAEWLISALAEGGCLLFDECSLGLFLLLPLSLRSIRGLGLDDFGPDVDHFDVWSVLSARSVLLLGLHLALGVVQERNDLVFFLLFLLGLLGLLVGRELVVGSCTGGGGASMTGVIGIGGLGRLLRDTLALCASGGGGEVFGREATDKRPVGFMGSHDFVPVANRQQPLGR
jgi:hypothetical protein